MIDTELLVLAAKAAGMKLVYAPDNGPLRGCQFIDGKSAAWNPLNNDGDALRLAVKCGININMDDQSAWQRRKSDLSLIQEYWGGDYDPCYRRAIVRVAAKKFNCEFVRPT